MKKRRIVAMALAMAMLSSSVSFNVYADDAAVDAPVEVAADETASGSGVTDGGSDSTGGGSSSGDTTTDGSDSDTAVDSELAPYLQDGYIGGLYTNVDNKGEWKAAVFGDAGGQPKVGGNEFNKQNVDENGNQLPYYVTMENVDESGNKTVDMQMGAFKADGSVLEGTGKISSSSDGLVYYYQELDESENYELSGKIKVTQLDNTNNQVSFGAMARDFVEPMAEPEVYAQFKKMHTEATEKSTMANDKTNSLTDDERAALKAEATQMRADANALFGYQGNTLCTNFIAVGPLFMKNYGSSNNATVKAFYRLDEALGTADANTSNYDPRLVMTSGQPAVGTEVNVVLRKQGDFYSVQYGAEEPITIDNVPIKSEDGKIYAGFYVSRNAAITISDIKFEKTQAVSSLELKSAPDKVDYIVGTATAPDLTGFEAVATYADGSTEVIDGSKVICSVVDFETVGTKTVTAAYGGKEVTFDLNLDYNRVTDMKFVYKPVKTKYLVGTKYTTVGMEIQATYKSGVTETLVPEQYEISIGDTVLGTDNFYIPDSMVGNQTVTIAYKETESILADGFNVTYDITVDPATLDSVAVNALPVKGTEANPYDLNEEFDPAGLLIETNFTDAAGNAQKRILDADDYTLTGFDSATEGVKTITVALVSNPAMTCTFDVSVVAKKPVSTVIMTYPRQTYYVGEAFDTEGLSVGVSYSNGVTLPVEETGFEWKVDTTKFNSSVASGENDVCYVDIIVYIDGEESVVTLPIKIRDTEEKIWKASLIGASSLGAYAGDESSSITVHDNSGNATKVTADGGYILDEQPVGIMKDGEMTNVSKVNVRSWGGAGKYATDHDGIAYYYTRVDASNNYTISADITVNGYIRDPENADDAALIADKKKKMQEIYDKFGYSSDGLGAPVSDLDALDMVRSGQEAFGIMARDVVPLYLPTEEGGDDSSITTDMNAAYKDAYGEPINIFEAYKMQEAGKLTDTLTKEDINAISFSSNVMVAGGATSSTFPTDPTTSSFKEKEVQNRITLSHRSGVMSTDGAGSNTKGGFKTTTNHLPVKGDKYNITLKRINYGYSLTTYDYTNGETQTAYFFDDRDNLKSLLTMQDDKNVYLGFFACRYADIDVENIKMFETDANNDSVINDMEDDVYSPKVSVESDLYTSTNDYYLILKASNPNGGLVTIKQGDEIIYEDENVSKAGTKFLTYLEDGSLNEFTIIYTPSTADLCYSYEKVVSRVYITQKKLDSAMEDIYVAPDGKVSNTGTIDSPIDLETAVGIVKSGQKVIMLDGVYTLRDQIEIPDVASGNPGYMKSLVAAEGADPVIDLQDKTAGFIISADYWHFEGFTVANSAGNNKPFHIGSQHVTVKNCTFRDNGDAGFQISRTDSSENFADWPSDILVLNCEAYNNCDPSKNNADGMACKLTVGNNVVFEGCVSHHNLDDGWDLYTKLSTGAIGTVTLENCATYRNGFELLEDGTDVDFGGTSGGNGFKAGGESIPVNHYFKDCMSFNNKGNGFDTNTNPVIKLRNVVLYNNTVSNLALYSSKRSLFAYDLEGVISYRDDKCETIDGTAADRVGSLNEYTQFANNCDTPLSSESNYFILSDPYGDSTNSAGTAVTADFFKSVDESVSLNDKMRYDRDETGAFIYGDFLARTTPYEHDAEDLVTMPDMGSAVDKPTEGTTATEPTTKPSGGSSGGGGGGGGGGSSSSSSNGGSSANLTATETTTTDEVEDGVVVEPITEITTEDVAVLFDDIDSKPWAVDAINSLAELGIINGVGNGKFAPDASCKRADFVIMLVNLLGVEGTATDNFDDVSADKYYYNAVGLAKEAGIVNGYGDGNFGPENFCSREELMVMVANALATTGVDITADVAVLDSFADADSVAEWAKPYVAYLVSAGIVNGSNGMINPKAEITRAEVAVIMFNIVETTVAAVEETEEAVEEEVEETEEEAAEEVEATEEDAEETEEAVEEDVEETEVTEEDVEETEEVTEA